MSIKSDHIREAKIIAESAFLKAIDRTYAMMKNKIWGNPITDDSYRQHVEMVRAYINGKNGGQGLASRLDTNDLKAIKALLDEALSPTTFLDAISGNLIKAYVRSFRDALAKIEPEFAETQVQRLSKI